MIRILFAAALCCAPLIARAEPDANFLKGVTIDVTMTRVQTCVASQYGKGDRYNGRRTASGEVFNTSRHLTAAMRKPVPFGAIKTVTNLRNGRSVQVRINDRGPFVKGRCIDLSHAAANAIGMGGLARVSVE